MKPCKDCGSDGLCYSECECAKCVDPEGYQDWKQNNPGQYRAWLWRQAENEDDYDMLQESFGDMEFKEID